VRRFGFSLLILAVGAGHAFAWDSPAPDIVLYCSPAMEGVLRQVALRYTAASHVEVHVFVAPPDGLIGLLKHRARGDVLVADAPTVQALAAGQVVRPETVIALGRDPFVLIGKAGVALPPGASAAQLVAGHGTVLPDPTTAASFDGAAILHASLSGDAPQEIGVADTPTVVARVREDGRLLGLVHQTEAQEPGISQAARLDAPATPIDGALVSLGQSRNAAALLAFIAGPDGAAMLRSAGLEPLS